MKIERFKTFFIGNVVNRLLFIHIKVHMKTYREICTTWGQFNSN